MDSPASFYVSVLVKVSWEYNPGSRVFESCGMFRRIYIVHVYPDKHFLAAETAHQSM